MKFRSGLVVCLIGYVLSSSAFSQSGALSYSHDKLTKLKSSDLETTSLLNSFDLVDKASPKNKLILEHLKNSGKSLEAKIAGFYLIDFDIDPNTKVFSTEEQENLKKIKITSSTFKFMFGRVMERVISEGIKIFDNIIIENFSVPKAEETPRPSGDGPYPIGGYMIGGIHNSPSVLLNNISISNLIKQFISLSSIDSVGSNYFNIEREYSLSQIQENSNVIIRPISTNPKSLMPTRISGTYSMNASGNEKRVISIDNLDQYNKLWNTGWKPDYGTKGFSNSGVFVNSKKVKKLANNISGFFMLPDPKKEHPNMIGNISQRSSFDFTKEDSLTLSYELLNLELIADLKAKGGYSCKNTLGVTTNCRDYTSVSSVSISGEINLPKCENLYNCLPVMEVMPQIVGNGLSLSVGEKKNTTLFLTEDKRVKVTLETSTSHTGKSGESALRSDNRVIVNPPVTTLKHGFDYIAKTIMAMNYMKDDISYINIVADTLRKAKVRTKKFPSLSLEEETLLYSVLRFVGNKKIQHSNQSEIGFRIIEDSIVDRLSELKSSHLEKEVDSLVRAYKSRLSYFNQTSSLLDTIIQREITTESDIKAILKLAEDILGEKIQVSVENAQDVKEVAESLVHSERNKLYIEKMQLIKKVDEYKLYGALDDYEELLN